MTTRDYNQEAKDLTDRKYAYDFDYVHREYMIRALSPYFHGKRALEMGCYKGEFTKLLKPLFKDLSVVEAASELVQEAKKNVGGGVHFHHGTFETAEFKEKFDSIFLVHTLEHLDDPVAILRKAGGWLTDGGKFFIVVPNANAPSRQIAVHMGLIKHNTAVTEGEYEHGHRRTYALDTLERDALAAGLRVSFRGGILFKPFANFQFDQATRAGIISKEYIEGCYQLGMVYPDLCASIYLVCERL
ncbi:MAG: class I SAM-dependent methyltransferase [Bdellovibrionota bacterium]